MKNLILLEYNNYFNRIVKFSTNLEDYMKKAIWIEKNYNFNYKDDIEQTVKINQEIPHANYLVVVDESNHIESRWFIVDAVNTRGNQYQLQLRRDVLVDFRESIIQSTSFIEKGFVDKLNPLIFNKEGVQANQIKQKEIPLYDKTKCGWIVGYYDTKYPADELSHIIEGETKQPVVTELNKLSFFDRLLDSQGNLLTLPTRLAGPLDASNSYLKFNLGNSFVRDYRFGLYSIAGSYSKVTISLDETNDINYSPIASFDPYFEQASSSPENKAASQMLINTYKENLDPKSVLNALKQYKAFISSGTPLPPITAFKVLNDNISLAETIDLVNSKNRVYSYNNQFFRIKVQALASTKHNKLLRDLDGADLPWEEDKNPNLFNNLMDTLIRPFNEKYGYSTYKYPRFGVAFETELVYQDYLIELEEVPNPTYKYSLTWDKKANLLDDASYKMFCFPYDGIVKDDTASYSMSASLALSIAKTISNEFQANLYDLQLLPYCPVAEWLTSENQLLTAYQKPENFAYIKSNDVNIGMIFYPTKSSFTTNIELNIDTEKVKDSYEYKARRELEKYRICSPNYSNFFDFDPYLNRGVNYINVDATYKPLTPYIKLNINFKELYGADFNDDRGLILGGDYSLPIMKDEWKTYQINNKNYDAIFNRETQHLEIEHGQDLINILPGAIGGMAIGGMAGLAKGGPMGGALGVGAAAASTAYTVGMKEWKYQENMNHRKDQYKLNLANIQARPQGLIKTSAFNINSRIVPFIETYAATEVEYHALLNKLRYNGMTVNVIDQINKFIDPLSKSFLKAKLIRIDLDVEDHIIQTISSELDFGIFISLEE